jgi:hypothetical protein
VLDDTGESAHHPSPRIAGASRSSERYSTA